MVRSILNTEFNLVRRHITVPANSRHFASVFILLVNARVASDAYTNFIIPHITKWSNPTTRPSNSWVKRLTTTTSEFKLGCTDEGGFYNSPTTVYNCMWYAGTGTGTSTRCSQYGNYTHAGVTANMACCACGGGDHAPTKAPTEAKSTKAPKAPTKAKSTKTPKATNQPTVSKAAKANAAKGKVFTR